MITLEQYQALSFAQRRLLTVLTFWCEPADRLRVAELTQDGKGQRLPLEFIKKTFRLFVDKGWLFYASQAHQTIFMGHPVSRSAYLEMIREGDANDWWPRVEVAGDSTTRDLFPELRRASKNVSRKRGSKLLAMEGLRLLALGSGEAATDEFRQALRVADGRNLARAVAYCAVSRFGEEPDFRLSEKDPLISVLPAWLTECFSNGAPVTGIRDEIHRLLQAGGHFPKRLMESYWALCVWSGKRDCLIADETVQSEIYEACDRIFKGDFKIADSLFKLSDLEGEPERQEKDRDYDNLPVRVLAAMVAAVVKPEKFAKTRPSNLFSCHAPSWGYADENFTMALWFRDEIERLCGWASVMWRQISTKPSQALGAISTLGRLTPVTLLLAAWDYHQLKTGRKLWKDAADKAWMTAKEFDSNGWASLTNLCASLLVGAYDPAAEEPYLKDLGERSVRFLSRQTPAPEWQGFLEALEKALPKKEKVSEKKDDGTRFLWYLSLEKNEDDETYTLEHLTPALRMEGEPEDGRNDRVLDEYELEQKRIRAHMSERDLLIAAAWNGTSGYYSNSVNWPELMKYLCGAPNLVRRKRNASYWAEKWGEASAMTLEACPCELMTSAGEDGGLVLEIPTWALECAENWCIRDLGNGKYGYVEFSKELKKVLGVFRAADLDGRLVIPREGMALAEPLIGRISTVMPLAEPTEGADKLKRVPAESKVRLRLDYADEALTIQAVVQPLADNPNLTLDPAYGPVEKMVVGAVSSFVLVRDLAAEKAAFEPVLTALSDFSGAYDGKAFWRLEDLADAIAALARLKTLGEQVPIEWLQSRRLSVSNVPKSGVKLTSQRTADDWFRVDGNFTLDDGRILSIVALLEAARTRRGNFVRLSDGDYVALSKSMAKELDALNAAGRRKGDGVEIVKAAIPMLDGVFGEGEDAIDLPDAMAVTAREIRTAFAKRPHVPRTLNAELRPYQEDGYRWLSRLAACGFGSCLADDMGLGKTIQVISLLLERAAKGPSLVLAPSSVCGNWRRELERFAPTLRPVMAFEGLDALATATANDVVIASYGFLLFHEDEFAAVTWNGLVLDEAQAIKNDASKRAKTVKRLHAKYRVAATGTPVENRLGELWSLFDFLNPGLLGPAASFAQRFTVDGKAVPELKQLVKPLILRRLKGDVLDDLPDKTEVTIPVVLSDAERTAYEACRRQALAQLEAKAESENGANRMSILAELTRLRRFCCHPSLVLPGMGVPSAKMEALVELLEGLHESGHRALVFSQFTDYLALVRKMLDAHKWTHLYLDGATPTLEREKLVNAFQSGEGDFFLISLKAGGTGLNLTAANYVILLDPWWNPAVENQAADRAHRIGQKNPVTVYRLIASDTVEARVIELHQEKKAIAEDVLEGTSSTALSPAQLMKLFT